MSKVKNILFIMADQLRWDYLSCYGHPHLKRDENTNAIINPRIPEIIVNKELINIPSNIRFIYSDDL